MLPVSSGRKALPMLGACSPANTERVFLAAILQCPLSCYHQGCALGYSSRNALPCLTVYFLQGRLRAVNSAGLLVSPRGDGYFLDVLPATLTTERCNKFGSTSGTASASEQGVNNASILTRSCIASYSDSHHDSSVSV